MEKKEWKKKTNASDTRRREGFFSTQGMGSWKWLAEVFVSLESRWLTCISTESELRNKKSKQTNPTALYLWLWLESLANIEIQVKPIRWSTRFKLELCCRYETFAFPIAKFRPTRRLLFSSDPVLFCTTKHQFVLFCTTFDFLLLFYSSKLTKKKKKKKTICLFFIWSNTLFLSAIVFSFAFRPPFIDSQLWYFSFLTILNVFVCHLSLFFCWWCEKGDKNVSQTANDSHDRTDWKIRLGSYFSVYSSMWA